tara:strand:- start:37 stop:492 length:456 start_codon:yes stop_codon:yes gene_type:complete
MDKINEVLDNIARPISGLAEWLLRIGLGISFFLHGYGKLPIDKTTGGVWLSGEFGTPVALMVAYGEMLAGIGIIVGGLIASRAKQAGHLITRLSGGAVLFIMVCAMIIAHLDWSIFIAETLPNGKEGRVLFASEQLFLILVGAYFAIKGNK